MKAERPEDIRYIVCLEDKNIKYYYVGGEAFVQSKEYAKYFNSEKEAKDALDQLIKDNPNCNIKIETI